MRKSRIGDWDEQVDTDDWDDIADGIWPDARLLGVRIFYG